MSTFPAACSLFAIISFVTSVTLSLLFPYPTPALTPLQLTLILPFSPLILCSSSLSCFLLRVILLLLVSLLNIHVLLSVHLLLLLLISPHCQNLCPTRYTTDLICTSLLYRLHNHLLFRMSLPSHFFVVCEL